ncbi:MAG: hypothetical protein QY309_08990 [Cyclobacteriaceae bacterium]|nr:MAG: hypothetical protein QY309_08990 [Cyclobacteriaceae bacterium]
MKTLIIICMLQVPLIVAAQQVVLQSGIEKTVSNIEYTARVGFELKSLFGIGGFYQAGLQRGTESNSLNRVNPFFGGFLQVPVAKSERLAFLINVRAGIVNENFFAVVPGVETRVHLSPRVGFSFGSALRHGHASFSTRLFLKMF